MIAQRRIKCISVLRVLNSFFNGSWNFISNNDDCVSWLTWKMAGNYFLQAFRIHFSVDLSKFQKDSPFIERRLCILLEKRLNLFSIRVLNPFFVQFPHHLSKFQKDSPFIEQRRWPCIFLYFSMDQFHRSFVTIRLNLGEILRKDSLSIEQRLREAE